MVLKRSKGGQDIRLVRVCAASIAASHAHALSWKANFIPSKKSSCNYMCGQDSCLHAGPHGGFQQVGGHRRRGSAAYPEPGILDIAGPGLEGQLGHHVCDQGQVSDKVLQHVDIHRCVQDTE